MTVRLGGVDGPNVRPVLPKSSRMWPLLASMFVVNIFGYAAIGGVLSVLLPSQVRLVAGDGAPSALALITGVSAIASLAVPPLVGLLSDRTRSRWGRRTPWILSGGLATAASLLLLGVAGSVPGLLVGWFLVQGTVNIGLNVVLATIPDRIPPRRHGLASTVQGLGLPVGSVLGVQLGAIFVDSVLVGYAVLAVAFALAAAFSAWLAREPRRSSPDGRQPAWVDVRRTFSGLRFRDYRWVFVSRAVLYLGYNMVNGFSLYVLQDFIDPPPGVAPADGVATALTISLVFVTIGTAGAGPLVDRLGQHRGFVLVSSLLLSAALFVPVVWPTWTGFLVCAALSGFALGLYLGVDLALATLVLPKSDAGGRDLGVFHIALTAPQVVAPFLASLAVTSLGGYSALFLIGGAIALIGSVAVLRVNPKAVSRHQLPEEPT
ncbi:MFS transporter [Amycolatopsis jiangsuensis]|uniref:MFS family permease n=1 Tax=Amycolatopsis jiangsuensis TaxID=1181879 RepID=A0A840IS74_9PSEU|nr:MFS transporter [Amycolatopsis jiangsuensis]MBB4684399.1 MFS family permease [Amycolatopsis jiangsuensis]